MPCWVRMLCVAAVQGQGQSSRQQMSRSGGTVHRRQQRCWREAPWRAPHSRNTSAPRHRHCYRTCGACTRCLRGGERPETCLVAVNASAQFQTPLQVRCNRSLLSACSPTGPECTIARRRSALRRRHAGPLSIDAPGIPCACRDHTQLFLTPRSVAKRTAKPLPHSSRHLQLRRALGHLLVQDRGQWGSMLASDRGGVAVHACRRRCRCRRCRPPLQVAQVLRIAPPSPTLGPAGGLTLHPESKWTRPPTPTALRWRQCSSTCTSTATSGVGCVFVLHAWVVWGAPVLGMPPAEAPPGLHRRLGLRGDAAG